MRRVLSICLPIIMGMATVANAQVQTETQQVGAVVDMLYKAMQDADKGVLEKLVSENVSYGHSSGKVESKQAFIDGITSGASDFVSISISSQSVVIQNNTAIARHVLEASTNDKGKEPGNIKLAILLVWARQGESWQLLARQAVKIL